MINNELLENNEAVLDKLYNLIKNDLNIKSINKSKSISAITSLKQFNNISKAYFDYKNRNDCELLIHLFGLFQGLFVAIDGCYSISLALTKTKWSVNINLNPVLHEIKFVRNDVVGHPSNRTYGKQAIGFSLIDYDKTSYEHLSYETHIYKLNSDEIIKRNVNILDTVRNYYLEVNKLLNDVMNKTYLPKSSYISYTLAFKNLYEKYKKNILSVDDILELKKTYILDNCLHIETKDRFIWRLNILKELIEYRSSKKVINNLINYTTIFQIKKIYNMAMEFDRLRKLKINKIDIIEYNYPEILKKFKAIRKANKKLFTYLNDPMHPAFRSNLINLKNKSNDLEVKMVIDFLLNLDVKKYSNLIYALGSAIKA